MNSNEKTASEVVIDLYTQACDELFTTYGLTACLQRQNADRHNAKEASYISILGASGEKIRISSTVNIGVSLLANLHPSGAKNVPQRDLEDWCQELNNQLVGRVKNKLLRLGCEVITGLPSLISGTGVKTVSTASTPDLEMRQYFFASERGYLSTTLAILLAPDIEFKEVQSLPGDDQVKSEGALALF